MSTIVLEIYGTWNKNGSKSKGPAKCEDVDESMIEHELHLY